MNHLQSVNQLTRTTSLVDRIVQELRQRILRGELPAGTRLIQEQVAERMQVSRTPLREAIRVLTHEGLLIPVRGAGAVEVVELSAQDAVDLYEVRAMVDGLAARRCAATGLSRSDATSLSQLATVLERATDPVASEDFVEAHTQFHVDLVKASGNQRLRQFIFVVEMSAQMLFPRLANGAERMKASGREHRAILDAVLARDEDRAERAARQHIAAASTYWLNLSKEETRAIQPD